MELISEGLIEDEETEDVCDVCGDLLAPKRPCWCERQ